MEHAELLLGSPLFTNISSEGLSFMLQCLNSRREIFTRGQFIFSAGDHVCCAGLVVSGAADIIREDFWGNRSILDRMQPGDMFGEVYAITSKEPISVSVISAEQTEVIFFDIERITSSCARACDFHMKLISNLLSILAEKNLKLTRKIDHISRRTTRQKLLAYLSYQAQYRESAEFDIPFNRQQLADYLSIDRSAMSMELSRMKQEGLIEFDRNHFILHSAHE